MLAATTRTNVGQARTSTDKRGDKDGQNVPAKKAEARKKLATAHEDVAAQVKQGEPAAQEWNRGIAAAETACASGPSKRASR